MTYTKFKDFFSFILCLLVCHFSIGQSGMACDCWNKLEESGYKWSSDLLVDFYMADAGKCDNATDSILGYYQNLEIFASQEGDALYAAFMRNENFANSRNKYYRQIRVAETDTKKRQELEQKFLLSLSKTAKNLYTNKEISLNVCDPLKASLKEGDGENSVTQLSQWLVTQHQCNLSDVESAQLSNLIHSLGKDKIVAKLVEDGTRDQEVKDFYMMFNEEYNAENAYESFINLRMRALVR